MSCGPFMLEARKSLRTKLLEGGLLRSKGFIAGEWLPAASGKLLAVLDPATGSEVEHVPAMGAEDTETAVSAAADSFDAWKGRTMLVRYKVPVGVPYVTYVLMLLTWSSSIPSGVSCGVVFVYRTSIRMTTYGMYTPVL